VREGRGVQIVEITAAAAAAARPASNIISVCRAVRQLLFHCGDELGWCLTEEQACWTLSFHFASHVKF